MGHARVHVRVEGRAERVLEVKERFTIGRSSKSDLVINHQGVSRRHAEIRDVGTGACYLFDAGSRNGTYVNGERVAGSRPLRHGDCISIANAELRYAADDEHTSRPMTTMSSMTESTEVGLSGAAVVVMVSDIRNYTGMTERFGIALQRLVAQWFGEAIELIQSHRGRVDKIHGDGMLAYWSLSRPEDPSAEVDASLRAALALFELRDMFRGRIAVLGEDVSFDIGVALTLGEVSLLNQGTGAVQSFTLVGDCVNVAFRLEALTKERKRPLIVTEDLSLWAPPSWRFEDLGSVRPEGRAEPIAIRAFDPVREPSMFDHEEPTLATLKDTDDEPRS